MYSPGLRCGGGRKGIYYCFPFMKMNVECISYKRWNKLHEAGLIDQNCSKQISLKYSSFLFSFSSLITILQRVTACQPRLTFSSIPQRHSS